MKLNKNFITHDTAEEHFMMAVGESDFKGLVRNNKTAAFIVDCLKNETSEEEIVGKMLEKYDAPREVIAADLGRILATLRKIGALDEDNL